MMSKLFLLDFILALGTVHENRLGEGSSFSLDLGAGAIYFVHAGRA